MKGLLRKVLATEFEIKPIRLVSVESELEELVLRHEPLLGTFGIRVSKDIPGLHNVFSDDMDLFWKKEELNIEAINHYLD